MKTAFYLLCVVGLVALGWWWGQSSVEVEYTETVRTVTVYYENPSPTRVTHTPARMNLPLLLLAPADTVRETVIVRTEKDSVEVLFNIARQEYGGRDTTFYAVVSGPAIGDYRPRLDWLEINNTERILQTIVRDPYRWEFGPAVGAYYAGQGKGYWIGADVRRRFGRLNLTATVGWDVYNNGAFGQVQAGLVLWRK